MAKKNITPKEEELEISSPSVSDNSTPSDSPTPKAEESKEPTAEEAVGGFYGATVNPQLDNPDEWYEGEIQPAVLSAETKKDTPSPKVENLNDPDPNIGPSDLSPVEVENSGTVTTPPATDTKAQEEVKEDSLSTLRKAYDPQIEALGTTIGEMQKAYDKAKEQDKVTQRRERNMQMIAGISDGLSALANLIGTGSYGSSHINLKEAFANPVLQKKFEEAQKERKKDIKDINERLSQKEKELLAMKLAYGKDVSSLLADKEKAAEDRAFRTSERLAAQEYQDDVREDTQVHQTKLQEGAQAHETSEREAKQKFTAEENKKDRQSKESVAAVRANSSGKNKPDEYIFMEDGKENRYQISKEANKAVLSHFNNAIKEDLAEDKSTDSAPSEFRKAYKEYERISTLRGANAASDQQVSDARKAVINASPRMRALVKKYGAEYADANNGQPAWAIFDDEEE